MRRARLLYRGFTIGSLGLGIAALAAVLTTGRELLFRDLPYPHADRLAVLHELAPGGKAVGVALENLLDFRERTGSIERMAAFRLRTFALRRNDPSSKTRVIQVGLVTWEFFEALGVDFARGRGFTLEEELAESPVVVVSSELGGETGGTLLLNEQARTIIGVLPAGFRFPALGGESAPEAYLPLSRRDYGGKRATRTLTAISRLQGGVSMEAAGAELAAVAARLAALHPETSARHGALLVPLEEAMRSGNVRPLAAVGAGAFALLAILLANLGSLHLARLAARRRELSVRVWLGARPLDLFLLVFRETARLTLPAAAIGLALAVLLLDRIPGVVRLLGGSPPNDPARAPDVAAIAVAFALALGISVLAGLSALRGASAEVRSDGFRRGFVVIQVALAILLLESVGLLGRSFQHLASVPPGFETANAYSFGIGLPEAIYDSEAKLRSFHESLLARLRSLPAVAAAGAGMGAHLSRGAPLGISFRREEQARPRVDWPAVAARLASPGYFEALGVPLLQGRGFTADDDLGRPRVALVNRAFADAFFPAGALGERIAVSWRAPSHPEGSPVEIVGVVADTKQTALDQRTEPEIVLPLMQWPSEGAIYVLRTSRFDPALGDSVRGAVDSLDGRLETVTVRTVESWVSDTVADERFSLVLTSILSASASALAALGLYGILAFWVETRRREIALRMALGANGASVRALVARQGLGLALLGLAAGAIAFSLAAPLLRNRLFEIEPWDGRALAGTLACLAALAFVACWAPARSASSLDPVQTLRE